MQKERFETLHQLRRSGLKESSGPVYDRINFSLKNKVIEFPVFAGALREVATLHARGLAAGVPGAMLITGQTGAGKTTLLRHYSQHFPPYDEAERTVIPIVVVTAPAMPSVKGLTEAILDAMGDPLTRHESAKKKTDRIYKYLKSCGTELLCIDEFQHFYDSRKSYKGVTDWVKNLISDAKIPVVLSGLPRSELVIRSNSQLARRFSSRYYIRPFGFETADNQREFRSVLNILGKRLPLPGPPLQEIDLARRFYYASAGLMDYVIRILERAVILSGEEGLESLSMETYAAAYQKEIWWDVPDALNPFGENATLRIADGIGEPFELWDDPKVLRKISVRTARKAK